MKIIIDAGEGSVIETIERSTQQLTITKTLMLIRDYLESYNNLNIKVEYGDCVDCVNWDLYCILGKDKYRWCRTHNRSSFKGVGD